MEINGEHFPTKAAATERCRQILYSYPGQPGSGAGQPHDVTDAAHVSFLTELVKRHPEAGDKIGTGISGFRVQVNPDGTGNTRCFHVVHPDGSQTAFSFKYCI
ncbi:DCL family protein [Streptomyces sp. BPPL-273]|uniref:DCL family protein n=1 Tax=Streptomyces sp. BPPL-273 TaxID=2987533 RepID=UPI0024AFFB8C|nr:DCL family protein [Streptomyces sp. BPPL-273]WHM30156.1 DCL family protein [Streptomyces sp. BPPL-273]